MSLQPTSLPQFPPQVQTQKAALRGNEPETVKVPVAVEPQPQPTAPPVDKFVPQQKAAFGSEGEAAEKPAEVSPKKTSKKNPIPVLALGAGLGAVAGVAQQAYKVGKTLGNDIVSISGAMIKNGISQNVVSDRILGYLQSPETQALLKTAKKTGAIKGTAIGAGVVAAALLVGTLVKGKKASQES